jgi:hypothetical protein
MQKNKVKNQVSIMQGKDFINAAVTIGETEILPDPDSPPFYLTY